MTNYRSITRLAMGLLGGLLLGVLPCATAWADGTQTGILAGSVYDARQTPLQGVEVRLTGPQIQRQVVTDANGSFRFLALGVGSYEIAADLLGLKARQRDVGVYVDQTTEIDLTLTESPVEEEPAADVEDWIQVVAEAPVIDRFDFGVGANVSFDFLDELPVRRFYQSVATLLPGVSGGEDGNPNVSGGLRNSNLFLIDGVDTTDPTTGLFGLNLTYEAVQAVQVTTAASPPQYGRASGAVINVVTRSGTNEFQGLARWVVTNNEWNDDYDYPADQIRHLGNEVAAADAGPDQVDSTIALSLGGPLAPERLFFFAAFENSDRSFLRPTLTGPNWDEDSAVESTAFKLTWQANASHTLVAQHTADDARVAAFQPFDREPLENRLPQTPAALNNASVDRLPGDVFALGEQTQEGSFTKLQWLATFGQELSLTVTLARQERTLERGAINSRGLTGDAPHVALFVDSMDGDALVDRFVAFNGVTDLGFEQRPRDQANISANAFLETGRIAHELEAGIDYQATSSETALDIAGRPGIDRATGNPVAGQLFLDIDFSDECFFFGQCSSFDPVTGTFQPFTLFNFWQRPRRETEEESLALYVSDTLSIDRWVFNLGLRYESVKGNNDAGSRLVEDDVLAPRVSVSYDPFGDGKVLLSASWGRAYEPFLQQYTDAFTRLDVFSGFTDYEWDIDFGLDCSFEDPSNIDSPCWTPVAVQPFFAVLDAPINRQLQRTSVDELVFGFERQFNAFTSLSLHYVDRQWNDLWDDLFGFDPLTGESTTEVRNLSQARREYRAIQALVQKRFSNNWQLLASYTFSEAEGNLFTNDGRDTFADFIDQTDANLVNRFGPAPYDRPHQLTVFGNYQQTFERFLISVGSVMRYRDGVPYQLERFDDFGVRFVTPRGSERLSGVFQWDLAATLGLRLAKELELELKAEIFNLTAERQQLGAESLQDTGLFGLARTVEDLLAPRNYRLTLGLRF